MGKFPAVKTGRKKESERASRGSERGLVWLPENPSEGSEDAAFFGFCFMMEVRVILSVVGSYCKSCCGDFNASSRQIYD